jgi:phosphoserine phosphatase
LQPTTLLATVTGRDRIGVTAAFFAALAAHDVEVRDVEQVVIRDRLILAVLVDLRGEVGPLRESVSRAARALGMECELVLAGTESTEVTDRRRDSTQHHVIVIGHPLRPGAIGAVTARITELGATIQTIRQLSVQPTSSLELVVATPRDVRLRPALVDVATETGLDIAVEPAGLLRRAKRLVVIDVDSTLILDEGIDVLAELAGTGAEVAELTRQAMAGRLDFEQSLRARVELLKGLPVAALDTARERLRLTPGAATFVATLKRLGYHVGIVSGGFTALTDHLVDDLGLEFAAANLLEVDGGFLTGRISGPIIDRAGKAAALRRFATQFGVSLAQTVAIGDGANDIDMIEAAGLGIAFNAKPALRAAADVSVNVGHLESVLFVLGISDREIAESQPPPAAASAQLLEQSSAN